MKHQAMAANLLELKLGPKALVVLLNAAAVIALAGLSFYFVVQAGQLERNRDELRRLEGQLADLESLRELLDVVEESRLLIDGYFLTSQSLPDFIEQLEKLSAAMDIFFSFTNAAVLGGPDQVFELTFKAGGRFEDLFHFLTLVEYLPKHSRFRRAALTYQEQTGQWSGDFVLNLFVRAD